MIRLGRLMVDELAAELRADRARLQVVGRAPDVVAAFEQEWDRTHPAGRALLDELDAIASYGAALGRG